MQYKLTNKELEIMRVLWTSKKELSITDFIKINSSLNTSTVQASLRSLLKKSYVRVAGIEQHNKVLARTYLPVLAEADYLMDQIEKSSLHTNEFFAAFIEKESLESLNELEQLIEDQKKKLQK